MVGSVEVKSGTDRLFISHMHFTSTPRARHVRGRPICGPPMAPCLPPVSPLSRHTSSSPPALNCSSRPHLREASAPPAAPANFIFTNRGAKDHFFRPFAVVSWAALFPRRREILRVACRRRVTQEPYSTPPLSPLCRLSPRVKVGE